MTVYFCIIADDVAAVAGTLPKCFCCCCYRRGGKIDDDGEKKVKEEVKAIEEVEVVNLGSSNDEKQKQKIKKREIRKTKLFMLK